MPPIKLELFKMHRRDRQSPVKVPKDFPNKYSITLNNCAKALSGEDLSSLKLFLQCNKLITVKDLENIHNSFELMSFLDKRSFVTDTNLDFLRSCFNSIPRIDLVSKYIDGYTPSNNSCTERPDMLPLLNWQPSSAHGSASSSQENFTEAKECLDGATAADCMMDLMEDEESDFIPDSQDSLTDDDKIKLTL
ncbi:Hypothetical predicted protein [Mytilus galloprovincialis]|uniref:DED domain-containing protein n=1 Tax=Mytilus galloprovincialis TaxID=29158 RepID=A0A8B6EAW8_MYTGA|nr:Hypothetical predicted protein [Mytilus galloprovincialis]